MIGDHGNRIRLMTFTSLLYFLMMRWRYLLVVVTVVVVAGLLWRTPRMSDIEPVDQESATLPSVDRLHLSLLQEHASVFRPAVLVASEQEAVGWDDYRFAGSFFLYDEDGAREASLRRAIISYRPEARQHIVSEGDQVGGAEVVKISSNEVVLRRGDEEHVLPLRGQHRASATTTDVSDMPDGDPAAVAASSRFGEQSASGTWQMDREALLAYYEELLDEPERLLQVFDSMQPIYTSEGEIEGYQLQTVGEAAFFEGVGFREGDKVRAVNTLPMTNRRRAEFFIRQVVENELDAIVIDLERDGNPERLVYELR